MKATNNKSRVSIEIMTGLLVIIYLSSIFIHPTSAASLNENIQEDMLTIFGGV